MNKIRIRVENIVVGDRARTASGDITGLVASIQALGLLQPIVINERHELVFGFRRLSAIKQLGWTDVDALVHGGANDALTALRAELAENVERAPFLPSEAAELRHRIHQLTAPDRESARSVVTQLAREDSGRFGQVVVESASRVPSAAEIDTQVAAATGVSTTTMKRVQRVTDFIDDEHDEVSAVARDAIAQIDQGAGVKPQLDRVLEVRAAAEVIERYPELAHIKADPRHVARMGTYLDELQAAGDTEAVTTELGSIKEQWAGADSNAQQRELAFEWNSRIANLVTQWRDANGSDLIETVAAGLSPVSAKAWTAVAADLRQIANQIAAALAPEMA